MLQIREQNKFDIKLRRRRRKHNLVPLCYSAVTTTTFNNNVFDMDSQTH